MGKLWALLPAYLALILGGLLALTWLGRAAPFGWATLAVAFAFPLIVVSVTGLLSRYEARTVPPPEPPTSILGRPIVGPIRLPFQWTKGTGVLIMGCASLVPRVFLPDPASPGLMVMVWWLSVAAFTWLVLPRLLARTTFSPSA